MDTLSNNYVYKPSLTRWPFQLRISESVLVGWVMEMIWLSSMQWNEKNHHLGWRKDEAKQVESKTKKRMKSMNNEMWWSTVMW